MAHIHPVPRDSQFFLGCVPGKENRRMAVFRRGAATQPQAGGVDVALLLRVKPVFGHERKAVEHAQTSGRPDGVTGFLKNLTVQGAQGAFTGIDPAPGQLKLGIGSFLEGRQNAVAGIDNHIDTGPWSVPHGAVRFPSEAPVQL